MKFAVLGPTTILAMLIIVGCDPVAAPDSQGKVDEHGHPVGSHGEEGEQPPAVSTLKELKKTDIVVGKGEPVKTGDMVYMTYTGKLLATKKQFDSNDKPGGAPYAFVLGNDSVIAGWHVGIPGMRVGGVRHIEIPAELAYGKEAQGEDIPANSDLFFEVKLNDVIRAGDESSYVNEDVKIGTGKVVKENSLVDVNYIMRLANGKEVDRQMDRSKPVTMRIGPKILNPGERRPVMGVIAAIQGMKEGGIRKMRIPPAIGFGMDASTGVPVKSLLLFEMHLLKVH